MQGLAQAQRKYDRQIPFSVAAQDIDAMAALRADLACRNDAQDISIAFVDHLMNADDDIKLLRALADDRDSAALAIVKSALRAIADKRALR
ncbi:MAG TPA: hypothetical protein VIF60_06800 [Burkholderiaceae bacterium]